MAYWLLKTEPGDYAFEDLAASEKDVWDGVRNLVALRNLKRMQPGDLAFIYHTADERSVVGIAEVVTTPYNDDSGFPVVDVAARRRLPHPVSLRAIKADGRFVGWELVRQPRLSVMPVPPAFWDAVLEMAGVGTS